MDAYYSDTNNGLHYDLRLDLDPRTHFVSVSGSIAYHSPQHRLERARFYLHRQFNVQRIEGRRVLGYQFETTAEPSHPFLSQAAVLDVYFSPPLRKDETALISFEYQGTLTEWPAESANIISVDWVELGMYLPWFPLQYNGRPTDLTFTLKAFCPSEYQVSSYGRGEMLDGAWYFEWPHPTSDIVFAAGRSLQNFSFESDSNRVTLSAATLPPAAATKLGEDLLWALERFSGWFGRTRPNELTVIESPRKLGGGYARRGIIVLGGLSEGDYADQNAAYLRHLSHEAAHTWWWDAPSATWEDWLNESFAEYSALLVLRERFGAEVFEKFLMRKRERAAGIQPLWGFERGDISTPEKQILVERLLYDKGPLRLHDLAQRIGSQRFLELCRARIWAGVTTTAHLLDLLEELEDADTRGWFEAELKT
jgi:hypothetical protein